MSHTCHNLLIHCMDFRLQADIQNWAKEQGIEGDFDRVSVAGAGAAILAEDSRAYLEKHAELSQKLHSAKRVIIMNHTDCGAYGGHSAFQGENEEEQKHVSDMKKAAALIQTRWPELEIQLVLIKMTEEGNKFEIVS
ncbi:carbonic anhydrase [Patescibacteria group bacterium]